MAVGVFAGVPVRDYTSAVKWYELLLGAEASFYPNEIEAVWQLAEDRYVYIVEDQERAGGGVNMIWVDDPVAEAARIAERGLEPVEVEKYDTVWKYVFHESLAAGNTRACSGSRRSGRAGSVPCAARATTHLRQRVEHSDRHDALWLSSRDSLTDRKPMSSRPVSRPSL